MNTNDGSAADPALRVGLCARTLAALPSFSEAPRGTEAEILSAVGAAGFDA